MRRRPSIALFASLVLATAAVVGCGRDPARPATYRLSGRVQLVGRLTADNGQPLGSRNVDDADGVPVDLLLGTTIVASTHTVDGAYQFTGVSPGGYFVRANYVRVEGRAYFSIFDSTFFLKELGLDGARSAIARARAMLAARGLPALHLAAIEPNADMIGHVRALGVDSVTNYVLLPEWKGDFLQDYDACVARRAAQWPQLADAAGLPYHPAVTPGWDASPRGADFGPARPDKYPWSPVVVGEHPDRFRAAVARAVGYVRSCARPDDQRLVFVSSLNEWSEGHYLEPDTRFGTAWIEAVRDGRA